MLTNQWNLFYSKSKEKAALKTCMKDLSKYEIYMRQMRFITKKTDTLRIHTNLFVEVWRNKHLFLINSRHYFKIKERLLVEAEEDRTSLYN